MQIMMSMTDTMLRFCRADRVTARLLRMARGLAIGVLAVCGLAVAALLTDGDGMVPALSGVALVLAVGTLLCEALAQVRSPMQGAAESGFYDYSAEDLAILLTRPREDLEATIGRGERVAHLLALACALVLLVTSAIFGETVTGEGLASEIFGRITPPAMLAASYLLVVERRRKYRFALTG